MYISQRSFTHLYLSHHRHLCICVCLILPVEYLSIYPEIAALALLDIVTRFRFRFLFLSRIDEIGWMMARTARRLDRQLEILYRLIFPSVRMTDEWRPREGRIGRNGQSGKRKGGLMATRNLNTREDGTTTSTNTNTTTHQPKQNDTTHTAKKPKPRCDTRCLTASSSSSLESLVVTFDVFHFCVCRACGERLIVLQRKQPQGWDYLLGSNS